MVINFYHIEYLPESVAVSLMGASAGGDSKLERVNIPANIGTFMPASAIDIRKHIREIPDFPKPGILFYDIGTLLAHPAAWHATVMQLAEAIEPLKPQALVGIESRGFLVAAPLAAMLG